jgi:hypothetical protein
VILYPNPLSLDSPPCGLLCGLSRRFCGATWMHSYPAVHGCEVDVMLVSCRQQLKYMIIKMHMTAPFSSSPLPRCPSRSAPPALVVWGLAGAFMVPRGCMGVSARTSYSIVERWGFMFCWLLVGQMSPYLYLKTTN